MTKQAAAPDTAPIEGVTVGATITEAADRSIDSSPIHEPSHDEIARTAYQRYLSRGASDGGDFDDWVEAERELRSRR